MKNIWRSGFFCTNFLFLMFYTGLAATDDHEKNVIRETSIPKGWIITTASFAYQIIIDQNGNVKPVFYGPAEQSDSEKKNAQWFEGINEVPVRGAFPDKTPMLEVVFNDNVRDADLEYVIGEIITVDKRPTLRITQKDRHYPLQIISYIRVIEEYHLLEKWAVVKNTGKKGDIKIENFQSGSFVLPANDYMLTHMAGKWAYEFQLKETELTPGLKSLVSKDFKSFTNPPYFMVRPKGQDDDKNSGHAWFGIIEYSGNWRIDFDKNYDGNVQIIGGINFWDTSWKLEPGKTFESPKFIVGFTNKGSEGAAQNLTGYTRKLMSPAIHRNDFRPVLYNSWYATTFNVNEEQQTELAKQAKEMGVEMFVIDDGWFKGRINDKAALGDWEIDKIKFPNGLSPLIKKINDMGMQFGIWIEPEMVSPNSDLYRKHPDWAFNFPNRKLNESRNQLTLNLAKEEVYNYLLESFSKLLRENNIKFIKWDHNRPLSEPGWPDAPADIQREVRIRYITNLYRLIDELRQRFPAVWFESCSSGGGRADLGMQSRMDMTWVSDNTDPLDRLFIHHGYLSAFPANTMVSWVTHELRHGPVSLEYKFDVSMSGVLGIGYDITKWTAEEKALAKRKVEEYKFIRPIVQQGIVYRLVSPFKSNRCAFQYVSEDSNESVVFCYNMGEYLPNSQPDHKVINTLKFEGLQAEKYYSVGKPGAANHQVKVAYKGSFLMNAGIAWPVKGANKSMILHLKQVKQ